MGSNDISNNLTIDIHNLGVVPLKRNIDYEVANSLGQVYNGNSSSPTDMYNDFFIPYGRKQKV